MDSDDEDIIVQLRLLGTMFHALNRSERKKLQAQLRAAPRISRVPPSPDESDRYFDCVYKNPNPRVFRDNFRIHRDQFERLYDLCQDKVLGHVRSKREVLGVTLDWLGTASSARAQETRFQLAFSTCHSYRMKGLDAILKSLHHLVAMPTSVPVEFAQKFPHFHQVLCAIDGGWTSTNMLLASDWTGRVAFVHAGVEGSSHDASVLAFSGFMAQVPRDFLVLADAGYALTTQVLTPFRGVRYHLSEWAPDRGGRPQNMKELFNLRHAKARNIIERVIGILKRLFKILRVPNECEMDVVKACIFAFACLHNFVKQYDANDDASDLDDDSTDDTRTPEAEADVIVNDFEDDKSMRDYIAREMWLEYQRFREMDR